MENKEVVDTLNKLIETSEDGKKGFAEAAEKATDVNLKADFSKRAEACAASVQQLRAAVKTLGGDPDKGGSLSGAAHRGWVAVKAAVGDENVAVLEECERGEDRAKAVYKKALEKNLPIDIRNLVQQQYNGVLQNHDRIRDLRDSYKSAA